MKVTFEQEMCYGIPWWAWWMDVDWYDDGILPESDEGWEGMR